MQQRHGNAKEEALRQLHIHTPRLSVTGYCMLQLGKTCSSCYATLLISADIETLDSLACLMRVLIHYRCDGHAEFVPGLISKRSAGYSDAVPSLHVGTKSPAPRCLVAAWIPSS
jgi:hypothetical protein